MKVKTPKALKTTIQPALTTCNCGGTCDYFNTLPKQEYAGEKDGKVYSAIIRKVMKCQDCGQAKVQFFYEGIDA